MRRLVLALSALLVLAPACLAHAAVSCVVPRGLSPAPAYAPPPDEVQAGVTNAFYLLSLAWSPQWCATNGRGGPNAPALDCRTPRGFILHGLWPNGAAPPYPRYCRPVGAIDPATVRSMFCRTPSPRLLQHEWEAHGACGWQDAPAYFQQAATLYDRVSLPRLENLPRRGLTAGAVRDAFVARNPWLDRSAIFVAADKAGRLNEVRLCYDLSYRTAGCPGGFGAPDPMRLRLTPSATGGY
jgi:ribonuclease T2